MEVLLQLLPVDLERYGCCYILPGLVQCHIHHMNYSRMHTLYMSGELCKTYMLQLIHFVKLVIWTYDTYIDIH